MSHVFTDCEARHNFAVFPLVVVCAGNGGAASRRVPPLPLSHGSERHCKEGLAAKFVARVFGNRTVTLSSIFCFLVTRKVWFPVHTTISSSFTSFGNRRKQWWTTGKSWTLNLPGILLCYLTPTSYITRRTQSMKLSINQNRYQSITVNRLILEIDEQSMRQDSVTFKRNNSQISIANRWKSMYQQTVLCDYRLIIDWPIPINVNWLIGIDWYRLIDQFSDDRFSSIAYAGYITAC